jgi:hypothetical protein
MELEFIWVREEFKLHRFTDVEFLRWIHTL